MSPFGCRGAGLPSIDQNNLPLQSLQLKAVLDVSLRFAHPHENVGVRPGKLLAVIQHPANDRVLDGLARPCVQYLTRQVVTRPCGSEKQEE